MAVWSGIAVFGLLVAALALGLAVWVFVQGPARAENRRLALVLVAWGTTYLAYHVAIVVESAAAAFAWWGVQNAALATIGWWYLLFLGVVRTPWAAPLRGRVAGVLLPAGALVWMTIVAIVWVQNGFVEAGGPYPYARPGFDEVSPAFSLMFRVLWVAPVLGLVFAIHAWKIARPGSPARRQAAAYLMAFGTLDAFAIGRGIQLNAFPVTSEAGRLASDVVDIVGIAAFLLLLTYGLLRTQLFDIDLKIKWTVSRATVATAFLAVFFVVGVAASEFLVDEFGYILGAAAAGLLLFALRPLQRLGERVADAAMPGVKDTSAYRDRRRREVYEAAYEGMLADGRVTEKEKDVLATLATELGLAPADVRAIEKGVA